MNAYSNKITRTYHGHGIISWVLTSTDCRGIDGAVLHRVNHHHTSCTRNGRRDKIRTREMGYSKRGFLFLRGIELLPRVCFIKMTVPAYPKSKKFPKKPVVEQTQWPPPVIGPRLNMPKQHIAMVWTTGVTVVTVETVDDECPATDSFSSASTRSDTVGLGVAAARSFTVFRSLFHGPRVSIAPLAQPPARLTVYTRIKHHTDISNR